MLDRQSGRISELQVQREPVSNSRLRMSEEKHIRTSAPHPDPKEKNMEECTSSHLLALKEKGGRANSHP